MRSLVDRDHAAPAAWRASLPVLLVLLALPSLRGHSAPSSSRQPAAAAPAHHFTWQTPWGPGGAVVPALPAGEPAEPAVPPMTRLRGAVLSPTGAGVILLGEHAAGEPALDPEDLLDALALSVRALDRGDDPGVSIDPTAAQLQRQLTDEDTLLVRYTGGLQGSRFGQVCFEADRLLKCLSLGKDNLTKAPFVCALAGHRNELDLIAEHPDSNRDASIHRFWIEPLRSEVRHDDDGRAYFLDSTLHVKTEYMVACGGKLRSAQAEPDASARAFCRQMTARYDEYAAVYPAFRELRTYAQMTVLASALLAAGDGGRAGGDVAAKALQELRRRVPRGFPTPAATPAAAVSRSDTTRTLHDSAEGTVIRTRIDRVLLSGGVSLLPRVQKARLEPALADFAERLATKVLDGPASSAAAVHPDGREWVAQLLQPAGPAQLRLWQTDLVAGDLTISRVYPAAGGSGALGDWDLSLPRVRVSAERIAYEGLGELPARIEIEDGAGETVVLDRAAELSMPGQPPCHGFVSGRHDDVTLYCFANTWIYTAGDVQYRSRANGPVQMFLEGDALVLEFAADAPHSILARRTADAALAYGTEANRVNRLADSHGAELRLAYDAAGRCREIRSTIAAGTSETLRRYRYDVRGRLLSVQDGSGQEMTVSHGLGRDTVSEIVLDDPAPLQAVLPSAPGFTVRRRRTWPDLRRDAAILGDKRTAVVCLRVAPEGEPGEYELALGGDESAIILPLEMHVESLLAGEDRTGSHAASLRRTILDPVDARGCKQLVLLGEPTQMREELALALRRLWPRGSICTASDPDRAKANLHQDRPLALAEVVVVREGLRPEVLAPLTELPTASEESPVLIIVGHSCRQYAETVAELGEAGRLAGRTVFLLTCGTADAPGLREIVLAHGAAPVLGFHQPIEARRLALLARTLQERLQSSQESATPPAVDLLFRAAVEEVEGPPPSPNEPEMSPLRHILKVIGRLHERPPTRERLGRAAACGAPC